MTRRTKLSSIAAACWLLGPGLALGFQAGFGPRETVRAYPGQGGDVGQFAALVHDSSGVLHVAYHDATGRDLKYARGVRDAFTGRIAWAIQTVDSVGNVGQFVSIGVTSTGDPVISYYDQTRGALKVAWDRNGDGDFEQTGVVPGRDDATGFLEIRTVDNTSAQTGLWTSIAVANNDEFHVSYKDQTNGTLKYARWNGVAWTTEVVDNSSPQVGRYSSIVVDDRFLVKVPFVFYQDETNGDLRGAMRLVGGGWVSLSSGPAIDSMGTVGNFIDAVFDAATGRILVSYQDGLTGQSMRAELKLAATDPTLAMDPSVEIVRSVSASSVTPETGDFGHYSTIVIGDDGLPRLAHYDATNGDLIFERRSIDGYPSPAPLANTWEMKEKPARSGDAGRFASADIIKLFDPVASADIEFLRVGFYDASRTALRLASSIDDAVATESAAFSTPDEGFSFIDGAKVGQHSSLGLTSTQMPVAAFYDDVRGALMIARRNGPVASPWSAPLVVDDDAVRRTQPGGLVDFDNDPTTSPADFSRVGRSVSMAIDNADLPHLAYYDAQRRELRYSTFNFATGAAHFSIDPGPYKGEFVSQARSSGGEYAVAYYRDFDPRAEAITMPDPMGNGPQLRVAIGNGAASWSVEVVDAAGDVGRHVSVAYGALGEIHVAYLDATTFDLKHAVRLGGGWVVQRVESTLSLDGLHTSIAIDPATGRPAISYYDLTQTALKYAEQGADGVWRTHVVDDIGSVGEFSKLTFDAGRNLVYIAYYDATEGRLKLASKSIGAPFFAFTQVVDDGGDLGLRPSTAIAPDGSLRISYYDSTNGDLLYRAMTGSVALNRAGSSWIIYR